MTTTTAHPGLGTPRRWGVFGGGLVCLVLGIAMSIRADLGVGSWQVFETGLAAATGASYGTVVLVESVVALAVAWVWFRERPWLATVVLAFAGVGIGALLDVIATPEPLVGRMALLLVGTGLIVVGVAFYLAANLGASAQDSLFVGFYRRYRVRPGVVRFAMDALLVVTGFALGGQLGVGTIMATFLIPLAIEPALLVGHRLAATPPPVALRRSRPPRAEAPW